MWNVICGNRILDRKRKESAQRKHIQTLLNTKSRIDTRPPPQYTFLYTRPKQNQIKAQLQGSIEAHNTLLVQKMMRSSSLPRKTQYSFKQSTLNGPFRNRQQRLIDLNNQKLVKRLQSAKSSYICDYQSIREYHKYRNNLACSRIDNDCLIQSSTLPARPASGRILRGSRQIK